MCAMEIPTFLMDASTHLQHGKIFSPGTLVIKVTGERAYHATEEIVTEVLVRFPNVGMSGVAVVGRLANPRKWYAILSNAAHIRAYNHMHEAEVINEKLSMKFEIYHKDKERARGTLLWMPLSMKPEGVQKIAVFITGDEKTKIERINNTNKWEFRYTPTKKDIPHFVDLQLCTGEEREVQRIWVNLPGRRTRCAVCGLDTHWESQCPSRNRIGPLETRPAKDSKEEEQVASIQSEEQDKAGMETERTTKIDGQTMQQSNRRMDKEYQQTPPRKKRILSTTSASESSFSSGTPRTLTIDEARESLEESEDETPAAEKDVHTRDPEHSDADHTQKRDQLLSETETARAQHSGEEEQGLGLSESLSMPTTLGERAEEERTETIGNTNLEETEETSNSETEDEEEEEEESSDSPSADKKEPSLEEIDAERKTIEELTAKLRKTKRPEDLTEAKRHRQRYWELSRLRKTLTETTQTHEATQEQDPTSKRKSKHTKRHRPTKTAS
jgi:hypothetical protein